MTYDIFINQIRYQVPRYIYICHCTRELKNFKSKEFYIDFLLNYKFQNTSHAIDFIDMYLDHRTTCKTNRVVQMHSVITLSMNSLVAMANIAEYYRLIMAQHYIPFVSLIPIILNDRYNYSSLEFSEEYKKLDPWLEFYHSLIYKIENDLVVKREVITFEDINKVITKLGFNFKYENIQDDIFQHLALVEKEGKLYWADKLLFEGLWLTDHLTLHAFNFYKRMQKLKLNH